MTDGDKHHLSGARFLKPNEEVNEDDWPRKPHKYTITSKFRQRMRELSGIVDGDIIEDAIRYGELMKASEGCFAFVNDLGGLTISIIVEDDDGVRKAKTVWPYIYDQDEAKGTGMWSSKQIWKVEEYVGNHQDDWRNF